MIKNLSKTKSFISPEWINEIAQGNPLGFNVEQFSSIKKKYIYYLSRRWGWNSRDNTTKQKNEFYVLLRKLRFAQSLSVLRLHILKNLNSFLRNNNIDAEILINGLPRPEDYNEAIKDLKSQNLDFSKVSDLVNL
jgi:hypothetical protein